MLNKAVTDSVGVPIIWNKSMISGGYRKLNIETKYIKSA